MLSLTPDLVLCAYAIGLFPMANDRDDPTVQWIEPRRRGIIPLDRFRVPRSLRKTVRRREFTIRTDSAFESVIRACAEPRPERPKTWLNDQLIEVYCDLFARGHAHSVECWRGGRLVGGLYGVSVGAAFFGESMFTRQRDASKVALVHLVDRLRRGGYQLLDTQFVTDHLRRFGAVEVSREEYRGLLRSALARTATFDPRGRAVRSPAVPPILLPASTLAGYESPQSITQTS